MTQVCMCHQACVPPKVQAPDTRSVALQLTVYESLIFSARLRFNKDVEINTVYAFVQEVMELVELEPLSDSLVGAPGVTGLSVEQRKRLTIAVELVANPSIVFMDEPTSGEPPQPANSSLTSVFDKLQAVVNRHTVPTGCLWYWTGPGSGQLVVSAYSVTASLCLEKAGVLLLLRHKDITCAGVCCSA